MRPRTGLASKGMCDTSNREDGRFFAPLRMTCYALTIGEMYRSDFRSALNDTLAN